jgi:hypothetical protein
MKHVLASFFTEWTDLSKEIAGDGQYKRAGKEIEKCKNRFRKAPQCKRQEFFICPVLDKPIE